MTPEESQAFNVIMSQRDGAIKALQLLDRQMEGNELYEHMWVNHPDRPEESPASLVRKAILDFGPIIHITDKFTKP